LNIFLKRWKEDIDKNKVIVDLKRAFETIDRDILMQKKKNLVQNQRFQQTG
jgi:hypothetical protein